MKKTIKYLSMAALAMVGAIVTGCSGDDNITDEPQQPSNTGNVVTLTTTISLDGGAQTRALTAGGEKTFAAGETMALIYKNTGGATVKAVSEALKNDGDITNGGKNATFTFTLTDPDRAQDVTYIYPAAMANSDGTVNYAALDMQDGTLATLSSSLDLATKSAAWDGAGSLPTATLDNQLAILALTLKDNATDGDITGTITGLTLSDGTNSYAVTRPAAAGPIYVAIRPTSSASIAVTATDGTFDYSKSLTGKTYEASNGYNVSWRMTNVTPLTMEALTAGTIVVSNPPKSGMQYSLNGGAKTTMTETTTIDVSVGDKVQFYGKGTSISSYYSSSVDYTEIAGGDAEVKVYGNIMSLVDETGYASNTTLTANYAFQMLFHGNIKLKDASGLLLPATTLTSGCYHSMFYGCTSLTAAPTLPATTLIDNCYNLMFRDCTSLTTAPALPATKLKGKCYASMFYGCTSLTAAPTLPATNLESYCYISMFFGCTSLTAAPALPATTLKNYCYQSMFYDCTNLKSVTCLATNISATDCTKNWLKNVASNGTFTAANKDVSWGDGNNGIPVRWTRKNAQ